MRVSKTSKTVLSAIEVRKESMAKVVLEEEEVTIDAEKHKTF
jgi:hypothetical protein